MKITIPIAYVLTVTAVSAFLAQPANAQRGGGGGAVTTGPKGNPAGLTSASDRDTQGKTKTPEQKVAWVTPPPANLDGLKLEGRKEIKLEVFTGDNGKVNKVNIVKSTGNPEVDKRVTAWVMSKWTGPKSAKTTIPGYVGQ